MSALDKAEKLSALLDSNDAATWLKTITGQSIEQRLLQNTVGFLSRAAFLLVQGLFVNGALVQADGLFYVKDGGTGIADLLGWSPFGDATPEHWGVIGNGTDETTRISAAILWAADAGRELVWGNKTYAWQSSAIRRAAAFSVIWRSLGKTTLRSLKTAPSIFEDWGINFEADAFLYFGATSTRTDFVSATVTAGETRLSLPSTADIVPHQSLVMFLSTRIIETDNRSQARHGWSVPVSRVLSGTDVELAQPIPTTCKVGDITGHTVAALSSNTLQLDSSILGQARTDVMYRLVFPDLPGAPTVIPHDYDPATGTYTIDTNWGAAIPAGVVVGTAVTIQRRIDVYINQPVKVDIGPGFTIERAPTYNATPGDYGFRGIVVERGIRPKIEGVSFRNFSECGLRLTWCYAPYASDVDVSGSNRAYNGADGTGYGISVNQSSWSYIRNVIAFSCRRAVDFIGTQGVSYHGVSDNIQAFGGGTAYDGQRFWPNGPTSCSTVGSHGGAYFTQYNNTRAVGVNVGVNLRGSDEVVRGVFGTGKMYALIQSFFGDGVMADGLHYTDGIPDWVSNAGQQYGYIGGGKLECALAIGADTIIKTKPHMISNIHLRGVFGGIVKLVGTGYVGPIILSGAIDIVTDNEEATATTFKIIRPDVALNQTLTGPVHIGRANILNKPNAPKADFYSVERGDFNWASGAYARLPNGNIMVQIANNSVFKLRHFTNATARLSLWFAGSGRSPNVAMLNGILWADTAGDKSPVPNSVNVDVLATAPTGTTGTAGHVSVCLQLAGDNALYVENRYGSTQYFIIALDEAA